VCLTTYQPDTKSNPNPNPTIKQHAIVSIQLNIVTCSTYPDKFIQDNVAPSVLVSTGIVALLVECAVQVMSTRVLASVSVC